MSNAKGQPPDPPAKAAQMEYYLDHTFALHLNECGLGKANELAKIPPRKMEGWQANHADCAADSALAAERPGAGHGTNEYLINKHFEADVAAGTRLARAMKRAKGLSHTNLLTVQELITDGGVSAFLYEDFEGQTLRDLLDELGCHSVISVKGFPLQAGARWVVERTNSWHNRGFKKLAICTERHASVIDAFMAHPNRGCRSWGLKPPDSRRHLAM